MGLEQISSEIGWKEKAFMKLKTLRSRNAALVLTFGGLKHGSAKAWEDLTTGFVNSLQMLGDALEKAKKEF
jgi:hypothetical protein